MSCNPATLTEFVAIVAAMVIVLALGVIFGPRT